MFGQEYYDNGNKMRGARMKIANFLIFPAVLWLRLCALLTRMSFSFGMSRNWEELPPAQLEQFKQAVDHFEYMIMMLDADLHFEGPDGPGTKPGSVLTPAGVHAVMRTADTIRKLRAERNAPIMPRYPAGAPTPDSENHNAPSS